MVNEMKFYKGLLGVLIGILALYMGKGFLVYFPFYFQSIVGPLGIIGGLGYIYMVINLIRLQRWAYVMFFTILLSSIALAIPFAIIAGSEPNVNFLEWTHVTFFWVSLIAIAVFGISALIRKIRKDKNNK